MGTGAKGPATPAAVIAIFTVIIVALSFDVYVKAHVATETKSESTVAPLHITVRVVEVVGVCTAAAVGPPHAHIGSTFQITGQSRGIAVASRPPVAANAISGAATATAGGCLVIDTTVVATAVATAVVIVIVIADLGRQRKIRAADNAKSFAAHRLHSALIGRSERENISLKTRIENELNVSVDKGGGELRAVVLYIYATVTATATVLLE
jgi:hypothetical protein